MKATTQQHQPGILVWWATMAMSAAIVSPIGVPALFLGAVMGNNRLMRVWWRAAEGFSAGVLKGKPLRRSPPEEPKKEEPKDPEIEEQPVDYWQKALDEQRLLSIVLMSTGNYHRFVRMPNEAGVPTRHDLAPLFKGELSDLGHEDSGEAALTYTLRQIQAGVFEGTAFGKSIQQRAISAITALSPKPAQAPQASAPALPKVIEERHKDISKERTPTSATGLVVSAGNRRVEPEGRAPYTVFSVLINDAQQGEVSFNGADLQERFSKGAFHVGDTVTISKRVEAFSVEVQGEMKPRKKNVFDVQVHPRK